MDLRSAFFNFHPDANYWSFADIISVLLPNVIIAAGLFFMGLILYSGFQLIIQGGQNNSPQKVAQYKLMVTYGAIGFLLVLAAYFILQILSSVVGINFLNPNISP